mgnify:CR=1 FL=1
MLNLVQHRKIEVDERLCCFSPAKLTHSSSKIVILGQFFVHNCFFNLQ